LLSVPERALLLFHLAEQTIAVPLDSVQRIVPMAQLARPPGLPSLLEGILNLSGRAVPVMRLDRLLQLPLQRLGLYSTLIVVNGVSDGQIALLVDRVSEILTVSKSAWLPIGKEDSFNACAVAEVSVKGQMVPLLSLDRILVEKEREALSEFQAMEQRRLQDWEPASL
jgi:purine-binding chemotaxis protein CheW